jgi:hypothetical protein
MNIDIKMIEGNIKDRLISRIASIDFSSISLSDFYIAGNSLNTSTPKDFDLFPVDSNDFEDLEVSDVLLAKTRNAKTLKISGKIVQLCSYYHESLADLVESFDFAHIKLGAKVHIGTDAKKNIQEIYISPDWVKSKLMESTFFTGSDYPLSSLLRSYKYVNRGDYGNLKPFSDTLQILCDIVNRGFKDRVDFLDQLEAIDLFFVPTDRVILENLYKCLTKER